MKSCKELLGAHINGFTLKNTLTGQKPWERVTTFNPCGNFTADSAKGGGSSDKNSHFVGGKGDHDQLRKGEIPRLEVMADYIRKGRFFREKARTLVR